MVKPSTPVHQESAELANMDDASTCGMSGIYPWAIPPGDVASLSPASPIALSEPGAPSTKLCCITSGLVNTSCTNWRERNRARPERPHMRVLQNLQQCSAERPTHRLWRGVYECRRRLDIEGRSWQPPTRHHLLVPVRRLHQPKDNRRGRRDQDFGES